jgi:hypothetical protein
MKTLLTVLTMTFLSVLAADMGLGTLNAMAEESALPCENVAKDIAAYVSKSGWGQASGYVPVTTSRKYKDGLYTFNVSIKNPDTNDTIGDSYEILVYRDGKSESCVTIGVSVN